MKQIRFFAVKDDLSRVLGAIEKNFEAQYVRVGVFSNSTMEIFETSADLPRIGEATNESAVNSDSFLIIQRTSTIQTRAVTLSNGIQNFCIDQLENPDTVVLTPAGMWGHDVVLYGTVGSASDSEFSVKLMKMLEREFKKFFQKINAFWVGPKAFALFESGKRLTIAVQSPKEFDLSVG